MRSDTIFYVMICAIIFWTLYTYFLFFGIKELL